MLRGAAGLAADEACVERENHLVNGRSGDAELDIGLGKRSQVDADVGVDESEILTLLGREARRWSARKLIHLSILFGPHPEAAMNVRYCVELIRYERDQLGALLSGGEQAGRKLKRAQMLLAVDSGTPHAPGADTRGCHF